MELKELLAQNRYLTWEAEPGVGTDKGGYVGEHDYINGFYNEEFKKYQDKPIRLLEIGIFGGASLALWSKFFPQAEIIGVDIEYNLNHKYIDLDRVETIVNDAYLPEVANQLGDFDIIIDDGPHTLESMVKCIELYLPHLKTDGVLVIEDIQDPSWFEELISHVPEGCKYRCIDLRENLNRYDDLLFVINL